MSGGRRTSDPSAFGKVAVLMGGLSAEREVSLKSGAQVLRALTAGGIDAHALDAGAEVVSQLLEGRFDRVFIVLHGRGGEDGVIQGVLDGLGLPYTGSGVLGSALAMDKWRSKLIWQAAGLAVPEFALLEANSDFGAVERELGLPLFVKPANEGSSVGVSKVARPGDLAPAYALAARYDRRVLAERFLGGGEYTVSILGAEALPAIQIVPAVEFYDYEAKYLRDDTQYLCPCPLSAEQERGLRDLALRAFELIGGSGWGRMDFLLDERSWPYLMEANTVPGMTDHSLVPMAARAAGIGFEELVWRILETSLDWTSAWADAAGQGQDDS